MAKFKYLGNQIDPATKAPMPERTLWGVKFPANQPVEVDGALEKKLEGLCRGVNPFWAKVGGEVAPAKPKAAEKIEGQLEGALAKAAKKAASVTRKKTTKKAEPKD